MIWNQPTTDTIQNSQQNYPIRRYIFLIFLTLDVYMKNIKPLLLQKLLKYRKNPFVKQSKKCDAHATQNSATSLQHHFQINSKDRFTPSVVDWKIIFGCCCSVVGLIRIACADRHFKSPSCRRLKAETLNVGSGHLEVDVSDQRFLSS